MRGEWRPAAVDLIVTEERIPKDCPLMRNKHLADIVFGDSGSCRRSSTRCWCGRTTSIPPERLSSLAVNGAAHGTQRTAVVPAARI